MNYLRRKYMALMRGVNFKGYLRKASGYPLTLTDCMDSDIVSLSVAGNAVQDGTPSPEAPVEVVGVGELNNNVTRKFGSSSRYTFPYKWSEVSKIVLTAKVMLKKSAQQILFCSYGSDWIGCSDTDYSNNKWNYTSGFSSPTATLSPAEFFNGDINTIEFSFTNTSEKYITDMWDKVWNTNDITFYRIQFYNDDTLLGDYYPIELYSMYDSISGTSIIPDSNVGYANFISNYRVPIECDTGDTVNIYTDKPLYGIDDYTDSITLDFEKKKAVRTDRVKEIVIYASSMYRVCNDVVRFGCSAIPNSYKGARMMCNGLSCLSENATGFSVNSECIFMHNNVAHIFYFSLNKTRIGAEDTDTVDQLIEKANAYLADNPITAYYKLGTPTETDISDTIDWDSLSLHLHKGTNILTSTATVEPTGMTAEYYSTKEV